MAKGPRLSEFLSTLMSNMISRLDNIRDIELGDVTLCFSVHVEIKVYIRIPLIYIYMCSIYNIISKNFTR